MSFHNLLVEGAFIISAAKENGKLTEITITSEKGGELIMENPFSEFSTEGALVKRKSSAQDSYNH